jgi:hypothetical protein
VVGFGACTWFWELALLQPVINPLAEAIAPKVNAKKPFLKDSSCISFILRVS